MAVTGDFDAALFPRNVSEMIFEDVARTSVVQQLSRRITLPANGTTVPVSAGKPQAGWVAEGDAKPVSDAALDIKIMEPKKLAVIVPFSEEFVRRDQTGLYSAIRPQITEAFADAFDAAAIHGGVGSPFTDAIADTTHTQALDEAAAADGGIYADLVAGLKKLTDARKRLTGFAADPTFEPLALASLDGNGRPILVEVGGEGLTQRLLGRPVGFSEGVSGADAASDIRIVGGDWRKVAYGIGRDISFSVSDQATLDLGGGETLNLWQNNMVAVRAEAEYGFVVGDVDAFVTYTETTGGG